MKTQAFSFPSGLTDSFNHDTESLLTKCLFLLISEEINILGNYKRVSALFAVLCDM